VLKEGGGADRALQETLPGVLEHTEFSRATVSLGRCSVCGEGRAVFRSEDGRTVLCEGCYARLVRAWNEGRGNRVIPLDPLQTPAVVLGMVGACWWPEEAWRDRIEGSAENVIVEVLARDALAEETFDGDIVEKIRKQIKTAFDEPETVEDHCFDDLGMAEVMLASFGDGGIDHVGDLKGVVGTGDDAEMADGED
jgi:hypothetical protein